MKPPTKMVRTMLYTTFDVLQTEMYKLAYNAACDEWLKWHEELRRALGAQPGDDLIERANDLFEEADSMRDFIGSINPQLERTREKEIEHLRITLEEKDQEIEELKERLCCQSDAIRMNDIGIARRDNDIQKLKRRVNEQSHAISVLNDSLAQNNMKTDGWKTTAESRGNLIEELLRKIAEKEDMLDTAAKLIKLQRDAMLLLLESVKTEKGEPNES